MGVSVFSPAQLDHIVQQTIPAVTDATHHSAIVASVDQSGAQVVALFTKGDKAQWQFQGAAKHEWSGTNTVGASVLLKW